MIFVSLVSGTVNKGLFLNNFSPRIYNSFKNVKNNIIVTSLTLEEFESAFRRQQQKHNIKRHIVCMNDYSWVKFIISPRGDVFIWVCVRQCVCLSVSKPSCIPPRAT